LTQITIPPVENYPRKLWFLDLSSFEAVHGMSRVLMLIPDKLATALVINDEHIQDDGSFLIRCQSYKTLCGRKLRIFVMSSSVSQW
jgi:hypothetical protein